MSKKKQNTVTGTTLGDAKMPSLRDKINNIDVPVAPIPKPARKLGGKGKRKKAVKK